MTPITRTLLTLAATHGNTHATLHGNLDMPADASGLVVFVDAAAEEAAGTAQAAEILHDTGFGTLTMPLLQASEMHFADAGTHLPQLVERLLTILAHLRRQIANQALPDLPIALIAAGNATPVAIRAAAIRDEDVSAVVCHGGLVDLAGLQYLRVLRAPLLVLVDAEDSLAAVNARRALDFVGGTSGLETLAATDASLSAAMQVAKRASDWLHRYRRHDGKQ